VASELGSVTGDDVPESGESGHADLPGQAAVTTDEEHLLAGRYRLLRRLGTGAMGVVWQGHDELLNRPVAVKKLLLQPGLPADEAAEAVARCLREGRIAARLHHPNAITVFDVVDEDGVPCLVMEYLPSRSMAMVLAEVGLLPPMEVATIGAQVAAALTAAHAAGIVHRDIKPANILLAEDGSVKITDFGISRAADDVTVTKTGLIAGTPAYLAPEVALGADPTPASDLFSLGATLYTAVEGESPFGESANTLGLLHKVAQGKINPPRQSGPLTEVLTALLAADPHARPTASTAGDLLAAVATGENSGPVPLLVAAPPPGGAEPVAEGTAQPTEVIGHEPARSQIKPTPAIRSRRPLAAAGILAVALVAAGTWLLNSQSELAPVEKSVPLHETEQSRSAPNAESAPVVPANAEEPVSAGQKPTTRTSETRTGTTTTVKAGNPTNTTTSPQPTTTTENAPNPTTITTTNPPTTTSDAQPTAPDSGADGEE